MKITFAGPKPFVDCINELVAAAQDVVYRRAQGAGAKSIEAKRHRLRKAVEMLILTTVLTYETDEDAWHGPA